MESKSKDNMFSTRLRATEPTIWALRKNTSNQNATKSPSGTLYEHLFGYDPIRLTPVGDMGRISTDNTDEIHKGSAENPQLNIINAKTNFAAMEIASDLPPEKL